MKRIFNLCTLLLFGVTLFISVQLSAQHITAPAANEILFQPGQTFTLKWNPDGASTSKVIVNVHGLGWNEQKQDDGDNQMDLTIPCNIINKGLVTIDVIGEAKTTIFGQFFRWIAARPEIVYKETWRKSITINIFHDLIPQKNDFQARCFDENKTPFRFVAHDAEYSSELIKYLEGKTTQSNTYYQWRTVGASPAVVKSSTENWYEPTLSTGVHLFTVRKFNHNCDPDGNELNGIGDFTYYGTPGTHVAVVVPKLPSYRIPGNQPKNGIKEKDILGNTTDCDNYLDNGKTSTVDYYILPDNPVAMLVENGTIQLPDLNGVEGTVGEGYWSAQEGDSFEKCPTAMGIDATIVFYKNIDGSAGTYYYTVPVTWNVNLGNDSYKPVTCNMTVRIVIYRYESGIIGGGPIGDGGIIANEYSDQAIKVCPDMEPVGINPNGIADPEYDYEWYPAAGLNDPYSINPLVDYNSLPNPDGTTITYFLNKKKKSNPVYDYTQQAEATIEVRKLPTCDFESPTTGKRSSGNDTLQVEQGGDTHLAGITIASIKHEDKNSESDLATDVNSSNKSVQLQDHTQEQNSPEEINLPGTKGSANTGTKYKEHTLKVYPNPASDRVNFVFSGVSNEAKLNIYTIFGTLLHSIPLNDTVSEVELSLSEFKQGTYICTLVSGEQEPLTQRLVVVK